MKRLPALSNAILAGPFSVASRAGPAVAAEAGAAVAGDIEHALRRRINAPHTSRLELDEIEVAVSDDHPEGLVHRDRRGELPFIRAAAGDGEDRLRERERRAQEECEEEGFAHGRVGRSYTRGAWVTRLRGYAVARTGRDSARSRPS